MTSPQDVVEIQGTWISPSRLVAYLERHGWQSRGGRSGLYIRFYHPNDNGGPSKVIVPLNPSMGDFRPLIEDAVAGVATSVGYSLQRLLTELAFRIGDKVRFRKQIPSPHGAIPWRTGESLVTSATKVLEAAAKAEREKTPYFGNKHWTSARSYLDEVRMGQTEEGSYVVTAFTPTETLPGHDVPLPLPGFGDAPTGRDVTQTLTTSLKATRYALDEYLRTDSIEPFQEAVSYGLSYELARGLVGVVDKI